MDFISIDLLSPCSKLNDKDCRRELNMKLHSLVIVSSVAAIFLITACKPEVGIKAQAQLKLSLHSKPECLLKDVVSGKVLEQGSGALTHNETDISWEAKCQLTVPDGIKSCVMVSQELAHASTFVLWGSHFDNNLISAQLLSDSDVNPDFGSFTVSYHCF